MSDLITLETVDADGAVREAAEQAGFDRRTMLKRGALATGGFVAGGVLFGGMASPAAAQTISSRRPSKTNDARILNYALTLEYLEAEFYKQAKDNNVAAGDDRLARFVEVVERHERLHVEGLRRVLGRAAIRKPRFDFKDTVTDQAKFVDTAIVLEDTGVSAYAGQGPNVRQKAVVQAALSIHSVEARHAAWIRFIKGANPAPKTYDAPASQRAVLKAVGATGFIQ